MFIVKSNPNKKQSPIVVKRVDTTVKTAPKLIPT